IDHLLYDSPRHEPAWDRFGLEFEGAGAMVLRDPRRLGGVQLDPDESRLGPDALSLTLGQLRTALGRSTAALKARLLDQQRLAGLGNLLADEALWRARLSPVREARIARRLGDGPAPPRHPHHVESAGSAGRFPHRRPSAGPGEGRMLSP
ncbi:MAG: hypothetical protein OXG66_01165, partial [Acidimicrobiaceae bacterium]|nr:hypothetical protein [Acidimicrobiaceae bacterium]